MRVERCCRCDNPMTLDTFDVGGRLIEHSQVQMSTRKLGIRHWLLCLLCTDLTERLLGGEDFVFGNRHENPVGRN